MAGFQQNSGFGGGNNSGGGTKPRENFPIHRFWGEDGRLYVGIWNSSMGGCKTVMRIETKIGADPNTGKSAFEQKAPNELPSVLMNANDARALYEAILPATSDNVNVELKAGKSTLKVIGEGGKVKITIDQPEKGTRTCTLAPINCGASSINSDFLNFKDCIKIAWEKSLRAKLDPNEFGGSSESSDD